MDNPGRGAGRTFAACHTVAGALESTDEPGVVCVVPKYDKVTEIMQKMVFKVFLDHGIHFYKAVNSHRFIFNMPDNSHKQIQFIVFEHADEQLNGVTWPVVEFTEYKIEEKGADNWKNRVPLM
jgi:hypothetical protein